MALLFVLTIFTRIPFPSREQRNPEKKDEEGKNDRDRCERERERERYYVSRYITRLDTTRPRFRRSPFLFRSLPFFGRDSRHRTRAEQKSGAGCTGILIGERAPAKRVLKCRFYRRQSAYTNSLSGSPSHPCVSLARSTNNPPRISFAYTHSRYSLPSYARIFRLRVQKDTNERTNERGPTARRNEKRFRGERVDTHA